MDDSGVPPPQGEQWPAAKLRRRASKDPRTGRLIATLLAFRAAHQVDEAAGTDSRSSSESPWREEVWRDLREAESAASEGRIDESWSLLHAAQRAAVGGYSRAQLGLAASAALHECEEKLAGWRLKQSLDALANLKSGLASPDESRSPDPSRTPEDELRAGVVEAMSMLHEHSQNTYLRMQLLARRLTVASFCLSGVLVVLLGLVFLSRGTPNVPELLTDPLGYVRVVALGALGALLSFVIGSTRRGAGFRIYELASGSRATLATRVLAGSTSAVIVVLSIEFQVITTPKSWALPAAVAAGFSERLVHRIIESVSANAEKDDAPSSM